MHAGECWRAAFVDVSSSLDDTASVRQGVDQFPRTALECVREEFSPSGTIAGRVFRKRCLFGNASKRHGTAATLSHAELEAHSNVMQLATETSNSLIPIHCHCMEFETSRKSN